jgi:L-aminopeptidase/D-esterase-like protein
MGAVARLSNETLELVPRTEFDGPELRFDFPSFRVGVAEYDDGPTGCTVFRFPEGAACATDVRGGSPGALGGYEWVQCDLPRRRLALRARGVGRVAAELLAQGGYSTDWTKIALVSGAIIFDYGRRDNAVYPDKALGRAALAAARPGVFPLAARDAGRSATVGKTFEYEQGEPAGQGGAYHLGETKVCVFTVVNAIGAIVDREGEVVRGHLDRATGLRGVVASELAWDAVLASFER